MYHSIVKKKVKTAFQNVNDHRYDEVAREMSLNVRHSFAGEHSLGGERNDRHALIRWFDRLGRVLPNLHLLVTNIYVKGWPHDTTAIVQWEADATLLNGDSYSNKGVHIIKMRWGKIVSLDVYEDSQAVAAALEKQAASGIGDAMAAKITS